MQCPTASSSSWNAISRARSREASRRSMRNAEQAAKAFRFCVPSLVDMVLSSSLPEPSVERGRQSSCFASSMAAPALCRPFDAWDARRAARTRTGCGGAYGTRIRTQLYFKCYCASRRHQGCHCRETETSVRLRFLGSSRTSRCLPVSGQLGCGPQSAMAGRKLNAGHLLGVLP
jgi:hypothetical protein